MSGQGLSGLALPAGAGELDEFDNDQQDDQEVADDGGAASIGQQGITVLFQEGVERWPVIYFLEGPGDNVRIAAVGLQQPGPGIEEVDGEVEADVEELEFEAGDEDGHQGQVDEQPDDQAEAHQNQYPAGIEDAEVDQDAGEDDFENDQGNFDQYFGEFVGHEYTSFSTVRRRTQMMQLILMPLIIPK